MCVSLISFFLLLELCLRDSFVCFLSGGEGARRGKVGSMTGKREDGTFRVLVNKLRRCLVPLLPGMAASQAGLDELRAAS